MNQADIDAPGPEARLPVGEVVLPGAPEGVDEAHGGHGFPLGEEAFAPAAQSAGIVVPMISAFENPQAGVFGEGRLDQSPRSPRLPFARPHPERTMTMRGQSHSTEF